MKNITLSTIGIPDQLQFLGSNLIPGPNLAVSLNSATDHIRSKIMPVNRKHYVKRTKKSITGIPAAKKFNPIFWICINGRDE